MKLAITPGAPRTPTQEAFIRAEFRREAIFEAVVKLRFGEHEYFETVFNEPYDQLNEEDRKYLTGLSVTPEIYAGWEAAHAVWKQSQPRPMLTPLSAKSYDMSKANLRRNGAELPLDD